MRVLVSGGAGFIGSHTCVELLNEGHDVVIVDNFCNSKKSAIERIEKITSKKVIWYDADLRDEKALDRIFSENEIEAVIHFAGLKAVGESVKKPLDYYDNNLVSTLTLLEIMRKHNVKKIVFSSSATVYGLDSSGKALVESLPTKAINPYGWTKVFIEQIIKDYTASDPEFSAVLLRYFNPLGAHESGLIGEDPNDIPNNLMPYISQVAIGKLKQLSIFGNDYNTPDGTGVRDYIHVVDLAKGHIKALEYEISHKGCIAINLGRGEGYSVLQVVNAFEKATGVKIPYVIAPRRPGDSDSVFADVSLAREVLGWKAEKTLEDMCKDVWKWQQMNPDGYPD